MSDFLANLWKDYTAWEFQVLDSTWFAFVFTICGIAVCVRGCIVCDEKEPRMFLAYAVLGLFFVGTLGFELFRILW